MKNSSIYIARLLISIKEPNTIMSCMVVELCCGSFLRTFVHVGEKCERQTMHAPPEL